MTPKTLRNFAVFTDGEGWLGRAIEGKPPTLTVQTEDYIASGMSARVKIDTGVVEIGDMELTLAEHNSKLSGLLGQPKKTFSVKGSQSDGEKNESVVYEIIGMMTEVDPGSFKAGEKGEYKVTITPVSYKLTIGGKVVHDIDAIEGTRKINGTDQLQGIRGDLG
ncbi:MAG: phage major tail tube protein [Pseudomonadota bacterium]